MVIYSVYRPDWSIKSQVVMSLARFDPSVVAFYQSFIVSQIIGCTVILSLPVLFEPVSKPLVRYR